jgi:GAF domain-containing protein
MSLVEDLTVAHEEDGLLHSTLEHAVDGLDQAGGLTVLLGPDGELLEAAEHHFAPGIRPAQDLGREVLARGGPLVQELAEGGRLAATPLRARQGDLGALVLHDTRGELPSLDEELLEALGKQIGYGLENVRLYAELRASSARVEALHRITAAATSGTDLRAIVPAFAAELASLQPFDRLACGFVNDTGDYIEMVSHPEETSWGLGEVLPVVGRSCSGTSSTSTGTSKT